MRNRINKYVCALAIIIGSTFSFFTLRELRAKDAGQEHVVYSNAKGINTVFTIRELGHVKQKSTAEFCEHNVTQHLHETDTDAATSTNMTSNRFKTRFNVLDTTCSASKERLANNECDEKNVKRNLKYSKHRKLVYCAIEKTGSTFWKRILYIIGGKTNVSNPTLIKTMTAEYSEDRFSDMTDKDWGDIRDSFTQSTSIMFVRDPYARLFSAWLDKFYSPNFIYWNTTGKAIARSQRKFTDEKCVNDISFTEFVNSTVDNILSGNTCFDRHFSPNYVHCNPCDLSYDYIGKYETMKEDTLFILQALNLTNIVKFSQFDEDAAFDAIKDAADWIFYQKEKITDCGITFNCALCRVWKRLQCRGIIGMSIQFPFKSGQSPTSREEFEEALREARTESDLEELKRNKEMAIAQALMSLPENIREKVIQAYERDFDMFAYERYPGLNSNANENFFIGCPSDM